MKIVDNAAGQFISLNSELVTSPNVFLPESYSVRQMGGGFAVSQQFGSSLTGAIGYDGVGMDISGNSPDKRNSSQTQRTASLQHRPGDVRRPRGHARSSGARMAGRGARTPRPSWNFTISAGQGTDTAERTRQVPDA